MKTYWPCLCLFTSEFFKPPISLYRVTPGETAFLRQKWQTIQSSFMNHITSYSVQSGDRSHHMTYHQDKCHTIQRFWIHIQQCSIRSNGLSCRFLLHSAVFLQDGETTRNIAFIEEAWHILLCFFRRNMQCFFSGNDSTEKWLAIQC